MRIINTASGMTSLLLGRLGENERTQFVFDVSDWLDEFPGATIGLYNQLPHSSDSYPVVISQPADGKVSWTVGATELQEPGYGRCELVAVDNGTVVKGHIWKTHILEALDGAGDAPDPWESWMTEFTELKGEAEDAAEAAEDSAEDAAGSAEDAEAWAVGQRGGVDVGESDPTYENNAKYYAENAAEAAEEAAQALIDDTAGSGDTDKVWSADKLAEEFESVLTEEMLKSTTPSSRTSGSIATTSGRQYAVHPDAEGNLSVNVPWTDEKNVMPYVSSVSSSGQSGNIKTFNVVFPGFTYRDGSSFEIVLGSSVSLNSGDSLYISINGSSKALTYIGTNPIEAGVYWVTCKNSQYTMRKNGIDTAVNGINVSTAAGKGVSTSMPSSPTDDTVPTAKAVKDYVDGAIPDISGKADKVASATSGNFAALDSNGNLVDSGHKHTDYLTSHQDISGKLDKTDFYATEMPVSSTDSTKVSEKLTDLNGALSNKISSPETAGTAGQVLGLDSNLDPVWTTPASGSDDNKAPVIYDSASGSIASFPDGADGLPLQSLVVGIEPVQSGSGDPSPSNVRPITGWTGANVSRTGKNLLSYTGKISSSEPTESPLEIALHIPTTITFSMYATSDYANSSNYWLVYIEKKDGTKTYITPTAGQRTTKTITGSVENPFIKVYIRRTGITAGNCYNLMIEASDSASDFEPYSGNTYSVTFPAEAGTVYGGSLDVLTGVLTVNRIALDLGSLSWNKDTGREGCFYTASISEDIDNSDFATICSCYKVNNSHGAGNIENGELSSMASYGAKRIFVKDTAKAELTASQFQTAVNGEKVIILLATAQTYQLDSVTGINSLLGTNNIYADCGDSAVTYRADTKLWIEGHSETITVDSAMSGTSENPVQNKVIKTELDGKEPKHSTITVSGTTPSITAVAGNRYICGEVATLTIVVPSTGIIDVVFDSGSTATVLTVTPPTGMIMKWANGFDPNSLEANTRYEVLIDDGEWGMVASWT